MARQGFLETTPFYLFWKKPYKCVEPQSSENSKFFILKPKFCSVDIEHTQEDWTWLNERIDINDYEAIINAFRKGVTLNNALYQIFKSLFILVSVSSLLLAAVSFAVLLIELSALLGIFGFVLLFSTRFIGILHMKAVERVRNSSSIKLDPLLKRLKSQNNIDTQIGPYCWWVEFTYQQYTPPQQVYTYVGQPVDPPESLSNFQPGEFFDSQT